jgi:membrane protein
MRSLRLRIAPHDAKPVLRGLVGGFDRNDLLLFASAISFQVLTALVPLLLFALGILGFFGLTGVWTQDVRPEIIDGVSAAALTIIDDTVKKVLGSAQLFWVTAGAAIATWQLSGAVRAVMEALNRVYGAEEDRSVRRRIAVSIVLAVALAALTFTAIGVVVFVPLLDGNPPPFVGALLFVVRWGVAAVLLGVAVGLLVHHGPDRAQPLGWVSAGAVTIVVSWLVMSVAFGLYLSSAAFSGSIYGALATVVVLMAYLYASSVVFLAVIQIDVLLRERDDESG